MLLPAPTSLADEKLFILPSYSRLSEAAYLIAICTFRVCSPGGGIPFCQNFRFRPQPLDRLIYPVCSAFCRIAIEAYTYQHAYTCGSKQCALGASKFSTLLRCRWPTWKRETWSPVPALPTTSLLLSIGSPVPCVFSPVSPLCVDMCGIFFQW